MRTLPPSARATIPPGTRANERYAPTKSKWCSCAAAVPAAAMRHVEVSRERNGREGMMAPVGFTGTDIGTFSTAPVS